MPTIWPYPPVDSMREQLAWLTDVLQSRTAEQRIAWRRIPRRTFSMSHIMDANTYARAKGLIRVEEDFQVPHWGQIVSVGPVAAGAAVTVSGAFDSSELEIGSTAIVWGSATAYETATITAISDTDAELDNVTGTYASALVMPLLAAKLPNGLTAQVDASPWRRVSVNFQIDDNIDASSAGKVLLYIALDSSGSMNTDVGGGITRMDNAKSAIKDMLDYILETIKENGADVDIMIVSWWVSKTTDSEQSVDAAKITSLKAFVDTLTPQVGGTDFTKGVEDAPAFFASADYKKGVVIFITDGLPSVGDPTDNAQDARDILDTITTPLETYGINIDLVDTTYTAIVDDTLSDGVPVVAGDDPADLLAAFEAAVYPDYYDQYRGMDVLTGANIVEVGGSLGEAIRYQVQGFDNNTANPEYIQRRDIAESQFAIRWHHLDMADMYTVIKWIHTRKGRQKAFWASTLADDLTIAGNISGTTLPVDEFSRTDFPVDVDILSTSGVHYYRRVTASTPSGNDFNLTMTSTLSLTLANVARISYLRCSRFDSDTIEISHTPGLGVIQIPCIEIPEP